MTDPAPSAPGYVLLHARDGLSGDPRAAAARDALVAAGWTRRVDTRRLEAWAPPGGRTPVVQVHRDHILVGRWNRREAALSGVIGESRSPRQVACGAVAAGWGDYVLAWVADDGRLAVLRSPAGVLDVVWWRQGGLTIVCHDPPEALDHLLPSDVSVDWGTLREITAAMELLGDRLPLRGLHSVAPGDLLLLGDETGREAIWRPADFCRPSAQADWSREGLARMVDEAVCALLEPHPKVLAELSGGLDSAVVAASLHQRRGVLHQPFITYYDAQPEGDERRYARAAAQALGARLTEVSKPVAPITREAVLSLPQGVRPALHGLDLFYDADMASRCLDTGATALLTGQGGDASFGQAADPYIVVDMSRRLGLAGLAPSRVAALGRWTRHSAWTLLRLAATGARPAERSGRRHPWLIGLEALPPAKAGQVRRLANAHLFWGDCRRARAAELLHPLLTQPVMEHCLAIPADILVRGFRDRGLARAAFKGRVPDLILERRSKGDLSRFYCRTVLESADFLRPWLVHGRLADNGLVDPAEVEIGLSHDALIRDSKSNRFLILALLEAWVRGWEDRLSRLARREPAIQPIQDAKVHVP